MIATFSHVASPLTFFPAIFRTIGSLDLPAPDRSSDFKAASQEAVILLHNTHYDQLDRAKLPTMSQSSETPQFPPDYVAVDRGPQLRAFFIVMVIITLLSVVFRFWSRGITMSQEKFQKRYGLDDWFALAAVVSSPGCSSVTIPPNSHKTMSKKVKAS